MDAESLASVVDQERRREIGLRRAGALIVRWGADDVLVPAWSAAPAAYLRSDIESRASSGFRGRVIRV